MVFLLNFFLELLNKKCRTEHLASLLKNQKENKLILFFLWAEVFDPCLCVSQKELYYT